MSQRGTARPDDSGAPQPATLNSGAAQHAGPILDADGQDSFMHHGSQAFWENATQVVRSGLAPPSPAAHSTGTATQRPSGSGSAGSADATGDGTPLPLRLHSPMASNQDDMQLDMEVDFDAGWITKDPNGTVCPHGSGAPQSASLISMPAQRRRTLLVRDRPTPPQLPRAREQREYEEDLQRGIKEAMKKKRSVRERPG